MESSLRWGLIWGRKKSRWEKKKRKTRFAVAPDELLRRLIRDLIICYEKKGANERAARPRVSKLEDKFTVAARCSFSRANIAIVLERLFHYKNIKNKFSLYVLLSFFLYVGIGL